MGTPLPTFSDTFRILLVLATHSRLRAKIAARSDLAGLIVSATEDEEALVGLGSLFRRLPIAGNLFDGLCGQHFFQTLFEVVGQSRQLVLIRLAMEILAMFALAGYSEQYMSVLGVLNEQLCGRDPGASRSAFLAVFALSRYKECAARFRQWKLNAKVAELFTDERDRRKLERLQQNLRPA
jgi:hypothetical protein